MKNFFIKLQSIFPFILIGCFFIQLIFIVSIAPYDELWNFQNVYKLYNHFGLYSDANAIITPLFYYFALIFLKLFSGSFLAFRYFNILTFIMCLLLIYLILKTLKVSNHINIFILSTTLIHISPLIYSGANYNTLAIVFILLGILSYLHLYEKKWFHFLQGFLIFLVFFTKQNLGIYYACSILVFEFIYKQNWLNFICNQFKKIIIFSIFLSISLFLFYINGNLFDFINYAFGGLLDFGIKNFKFSADIIYPANLCLIVIILYFYIISNKKINLPSENIQNLNLFGCIAIGTTFSCYPLFNLAHFLYIIIFYLLILFYIFDFLILEDILSSPKCFSIIYTISSIMLLCLLLQPFVSSFLSQFTEETKEEYIPIADSSSPFYNLYMNTEDYEKMNTMTKYIKEKNKSGKEVIIIASDSCLTMVPIKQNNGAFDLVFNGNLGYNGENVLIGKIKDSKNTEFLIFTNEEDCFWQESKKIRNFIMENLNKTGEILNYSIYEFPNN